MGTASAGRDGWYGPEDQGVCGTCGAIFTAAEMFCGSCGVYLGWETTSGRRAAESARTLRATPQLRPDQYPDLTAVSAPSSTHPVQHTISGSEWQGQSFTELALVPVAYDTPDRAQSTTDAEAGVRQALCPACCGANPRSRTYCQSCGALLRPKPQPPTPTRWQRLREKYRGKPEVWHFDHRWTTLLAGLPVCAAAGFGLGGLVSSAERAIPWIKDRFLPQYAIAPETVDASSSAQGYDARLATDGVDNKAWAPAGGPGQAPGQYWQATFQSPFRLTTLLMINGAATKPAAFFESGRPTRVTVTITTADQKTVKRQMNLADQPGVQRLNAGVEQVTAVQIMINTVHPGLKPTAPIALAEVQFFSRREM